MTTCITKDGQTTVTGNIPFGGFRLTNIGAATALTDAARANQVQNSSLTYLTSVSGVDTITANAAVTPAAYAAGQMFHFVSAGANTGAVTLNVSGLGAKDVTKNGTTALSAGDIPSGATISVIYDGTRFQIVRNGAVGLAGNETIAGVKTFSSKPVLPATTPTGNEAASASFVESQFASTAGQKNVIKNGSFAVNQRVTAPTTDNAYCLDRWRLLLGAANAATVTQNTADVPTGAGYSCVLTVGSGNNNKFGIFQPIENKDMLQYRGGVCSIRVPLKATAGLTDGTGKIRIGIMQWTSTADAISADPISAWGAEGTNPTLIANWAFANTPSALSVTTSWADYTVENVSISASATNLGILIWSDDTTNTQTTDVLRIGGYVTMTKSSVAPAASVALFDDELAACQRYYYKTFAYGTAPAQNVGVNTGEFIFQSITSSASAAGSLCLPYEMFSAPTLTTYNPSAANTQVRDESAGADCAATATRTSAKILSVSCTTSVGTGNGFLLGIHIQAVAEL